MPRTSRRLPGGMAPSVLASFVAVALSLGRARADVDPTQPLPGIALLGKPGFDAIAAAEGDTTDGMPAALQSNPLYFHTLTDFWCAYELTDRKRKPALLIDDMQIEYTPYVTGITPQVQILIAAFRKAGLPIFWSTWWRWGPDDGFFNSMDRFYGPIGYTTSANALYNHNRTHGGDVMSEVAPITEEERRRVMHKSYSLDMFDERPMQWLVPDGQGTLHSELQQLGVDTVVQVGAWTDDCIISTAFHAFSLQYDVVLIEDGVSTASKQHFNAIEVMRGAVAKVLFAADVVDYITKGLPVTLPATPRSKLAGGRSTARAGTRPSPMLPSRTELMAAPPAAGQSGQQGQAVGEAVAQLLNSMIIVLVGPCCFLGGWIARGRAGRASAHAPFLG